jgi:hypothetical protein
MQKWTIDFFVWTHQNLIILGSLYVKLQGELCILFKFFWDRELLRLEGASFGCAGCINSQPTRPADETLIKPRFRVERLPPSPHVKEPSVTAHYEHYVHYEHYAHDEWSIRDLLHWQNYPSLPITFPCFESCGV